MKVILDIGHGSDNFYKGVPGLQEFEFNNDVVKRASDIITLNSFVDVFFTQPMDGITIPLSKRVELANASDADILISCHADASGDPKANGHWGFYWGGSAKGKQLADIWRKHAIKLPNKDRGLIPCKTNHWTNFYIVRKPKQPCLLIEHAFMTNADDLKLLQSDEFRQVCAQAIADTVFEWFNINVDMKDYKKLYEESIDKLEKIRSVLNG